MGNLTKNLSRHEFECTCGCGFDTVDVELPGVIQGCADHFTHVDGIDVRIDITGPNRCREYNESVQKKYDPKYIPYSSDTQHMQGRAADFKLINRDTGEQVAAHRVASYLEGKYPRKYGVGRYHNRIHFDTKSGGPRRWKG